MNIEYLIKLEILEYIKISEEILRDFNKFYNNEKYKGDKDFLVKQLCEDYKFNLNKLEEEIDKILDKYESRFKNGRFISN